MADPDTTFDPEAVSAEIQDARFVYGSILVGNQLNLVECIDEEQFAEGELDRTHSTAFASIGASLIPFITETKETITLDVPTSAAPHLDGDYETPRLTTFDRTASVISDARAYYFLLNTTDNEWKRIQNAVPEKFDEYEPLVGRYLVADVLVDESSDRIADVDGSADPGDFDIIDWSA